MKIEPAPKQPEPIGYRAVRDQTISGPGGLITVEANRPITDQFVIATLQRPGVTLLADYDD